VTLELLDNIGHVFALVLVLHPVLLLNHFLTVTDSLTLDEGVSFPFKGGLWARLHPQEDHLFFTHLFNHFTGGNATEPLLEDFCGFSLLNLLAGFHLLASLESSTVTFLLLLILDDLPDSVDTSDALATSLRTLDVPDSGIDVHINSKDVMDVLLNLIRLIQLQGLFKSLVNNARLPFQGHLGGAWFCLLISTLLLLLFLLFFLLLFAATVYLFLDL